jgi:hypothetical protein
MFDLSRFKKWFARDRTGRQLGEHDAPADTGSARSRETGGVDQPDARTRIARPARLRVAAS